MISLKKAALLSVFAFISISISAQAYVEDEEIVDLLAGETELVNDPGELEDNLLYASRFVMTVIEPSQKHEMNPQLSTYVSDSQLFSGIYEGLFSYDPKTLDPLPAICQNYKISRDKKRWTFYLRQNACFSDGTPITAEDVRRSWIQLLETPGAPYSSMLDIIEGAQELRTGKGSAGDVAITAVSTDAVSIRLKTPASYLPRLLCHSAFSVIHRSPTVYSGAYSISDIKEGQILLEKNPYYWDADNVSLKMICFFQSLGAEENTYFYNTGFSEWITSYEILSQNIMNPKALHYDGEFGTEYLFFKTSSAKPEVNDLRFVWDIPVFRQAVMEALPWEALRKNSLVKAETFVYPLPGYPAVEGYSYTDFSEAKLLMKDARKIFGISENEILPLKMLMSEGSFSEAEFTAMKNALEPLGVELSIQFVPFDQYLFLAEMGDADIVSYNWIGDFADPLAFLELFRGDSTLNVSGWKNEKFDRLINEAAENSDAKKRYELLSEAEKILLDDGMVIPISHPVSLSVVNTDEIGGWFPNAMNIHPLKYIYKKDVKPDLTNCF